jgi:flagellar hook-length control protein FliK
MEQMEILLNVPTVSKTTVSSTPKAVVTDDDKSFADLYERNINESKSSNAERTQKSSKKDDSVENSAESESKVENKADKTATPNAEATEKDVDENTAAVNWINVLDLASDSNNEENAEIVSETDVLGSTSEEAQMATAESDTNSKTDISSANEMEAGVTDETANLSESHENEKSMIDASKVIASSTNVSESKTADGIAEETNSKEIVENTVQSEVVAKSINEAANQVTGNANNVTKQNAETAPVNGDFSTMMSDNIPQSNVQESVLTQIGNSLGKVVKTGNNEIRIQLEPEQLGVINVRIIAGKDGTQVVFKADSHQSSQLIAGQTETLKTMLNEAGIKVDQVVVNDFSFSQDNYQDQQTFDQQNGKSNKFYKSSNHTDGQMETYDAGYELPQTIVGLNYLI